MDILGYFEQKKAALVAAYRVKGLKGYNLKCFINKS